jgi:WD40 repeat protein
MIKTKLNRRRYLLATSTLLASIIGTTQIAIGEGVGVPLSQRLAPLRPDDPSPVVTAMALDPHGQLLAVGSDDGAIRLLNTSDLSQRDLLVGHRDLVRSIAFRPDGLCLVSAGNDGRIILWDRRQGWSILRQINDLPTIFSARFSPDGKQLAAVGFDTSLMLFESGDRPKLDCKCADLRGVAYNRSGDRLAVVGRTGKLHLFDPRAGKSIGEYSIHSSRVRDITFLPDTQLAATVGEDGTATIFDLDVYKVVKQIDLLPCKLFTVVAIDRETIAVAGSDNRIRLINITTGRVTSFLEGHLGSINSLAYADGVLYSGGFDTTVRKWQLPVSQDQRLAEREKATGR